MSTVQCDIVSAEAEIFRGQVTMVVASGSEGELGITPNHIPLVTQLKPGQIRLHGEQGEEQFFFVSGGILEVQPEVVTILADTVLRADEIDEGKAEKAKQEAQQAISGGGEKKDLAEAREQLNHAQAQLDALSRLRKTLKH